MKIMNELIGAIGNIEFEKISWKMNDSDNCSLAADEIELAIEEYKRFLTLKSQHPNIRLAPTELMDEVWHFHILDTARYAADCRAIFGKFLHHSPSYGPFESEEKQSSMQESFARMVKLYCESFGHDPITRMGSCSSACSGVACE